MAYEFTDTMGEISGFGGSYEAGCRAMVKAGLEWFDAHPAAEPRFHGLKDVYGLCIEDNEDAKALSDAMLAAPMTDPETGNTTTVGTYGATGAMHQACVGHIFAIRRQGWDWYVREMSAPCATEA